MRRSGTVGNVIHRRPTKDKGEKDDILWPEMCTKHQQAFQDY